MENGVKPEGEDLSHAKPGFNVVYNFMTAARRQRLAVVSKRLNRVRCRVAIIDIGFALGRLLEVLLAAGRKRFATRWTLSDSVSRWSRFSGSTRAVESAATTIARWGWSGRRDSNSTTLCLGSIVPDVCPSRADAQIRFRPLTMSGGQSGASFGHLPQAVPSI